MYEIENETKEKTKIKHWNDNKIESKVGVGKRAEYTEKVNRKNGTSSWKQKHPSYQLNTLNYAKCISNSYSVKTEVETKEHIL